MRRLIKRVLLAIFAASAFSKQITLRRFHRIHPLPATPLDPCINGAVGKS